MPKIIVTSRYLKSGSGKKKQLYHYVKYIATREGSVPTPNANETAPATKNQQELISSLLKCFPDSKELFEYEDYIKNPTVKNGSALISEILDRNMDRLTNRENYVGYLANRPGAVKLGSHGLFNEKDEPIILDRVANEIANHGGNVWTHVVSLRRDNAQAMGYDNLKAWRELVKRQIPNIAKNQKIDMKNLKWYAAFHDKKTNPHVHIIVYSTNEREGFLTNHGIEKIRSGFANDIYADELHNLYAQQTDLRNLMKKESEQLMKQLADNISKDNNFDADLFDLVAKLHGQLSSSKGKKVYRYLKPEVKQTVDTIFSKLADNESIQKMYSLWCEMEQQKHDVYSSARVQFPKLADNKEFKSVKNMIIRTVLDMNYPVVDAEMDEPEPTEQSEDNSDSSTVEIPPQMDKAIDYFKFSAEMNNKNGLYEYGKALLLGEHITQDKQKAVELLEKAIKLENINAKRFFALEYLSGEHFEQDFEKGLVMLTECADSGDTFACYKLGKIYFKSEIVLQDLEKAEKYLLSAEDNEYTQYALGKLYLQEEKYDIQKAVNYFEKSADKNMWSSYQLGRLYLFGAEGLEKDKEKAVEWLTKSAIGGNEYAQNILDDIDNFENQTLKNTLLSLFANLSRCIEDDYTQKYKSVRRTVDSRLRRMIRQKKQSLGIKENFTQSLD